MVCAFVGVLVEMIPRVLRLDSGTRALGLVRMRVSYHELRSYIKKRQAIILA